MKPSQKPSHDEQASVPATPGGRPAATEPAAAQRSRPPALPREIGGRVGPEPTRFGDWEKAGRCIDF